MSVTFDFYYVVARPSVITALCILGQKFSMVLLRSDPILYVATSSAYCRIGQDDVIAVTLLT